MSSLYRKTRMLYTGNMTDKTQPNPVNQTPPTPQPQPGKVPTITSQTIGNHTLSVEIH